MGLKYEFTDETMNYEGHLLHRIRRLSDGKIGGWIEFKYNLSPEGDCWVADNAKVYGDAQVYGNALICGNAQVCGDAHIDGDTNIHGNIKISSGEYTDGDYFNEKDSSNENVSREVVQDFIYKVDNSDKIATQTEYNSIDEFFDAPVENDIKLDTLVICAIDTKEPLIKLQKVKTENKTEFKFIVDIINEDNDNFMFKSTIKSQEQLNELIQQTIDMLNQSPKFSKYADDLENCL